MESTSPGAMGAFVQNYGRRLHYACCRYRKSSALSIISNGFRTGRRVRRATTGTARETSESHPSCTWTSLENWTSYCDGASGAGEDLGTRRRRQGKHSFRCNARIPPDSGCSIDCRISAAASSSYFRCHRGRQSKGVHGRRMRFDAVLRPRQWCQPCGKLGHSIIVRSMRLAQIFRKGRLSRKSGRTVRSCRCGLYGPSQAAFGSFG